MITMQGRKKRNLYTSIVTKPWSVFKKHFKRFGDEEHGNEKQEAGCGDGPLICAGAPGHACTDTTRAKGVAEKLLWQAETVGTSSHSPTHSQATIHQSTNKFVIPRHSSNTCLYVTSNNNRPDLMPAQGWSAKRINQPVAAAKLMLITPC